MGYYTFYLCIVITCENDYDWTFSDSTTAIQNFIFIQCLNLTCLIYIRPKYRIYNTNISKGVKNNKRIGLGIGHALGHALDHALGHGTVAIHKDHRKFNDPGNEPLLSQKDSKHVAFEKLKSPNHGILDPALNITVFDNNYSPNIPSIELTNSQTNTATLTRTTTAATTTSTRPAGHTITYAMRRNFKSTNTSNFATFDGSFFDSDFGSSYLVRHDRSHSTIPSSQAHYTPAPSKSTTKSGGNAIQILNPSASGSGNGNSDGNGNGSYRDKSRRNASSNFNFGKYNRNASKSNVTTVNMMNFMIYW